MTPLPLCPSMVESSKITDVQCEVLPHYPSHTLRNYGPPLPTHSKIRKRLCAGDRGWHLYDYVAERLCCRRELEWDGQMREWV
jgi:hypothetical protein